MGRPRSDNPTGADNQQERLGSTAAWRSRVSPDLGHYVAGFVDGEGSFNVPIRRERDRALPWRVSLSFNVSQLGPEAPELLRSVFETGTVRARRDGVYYFEVTKAEALEARVFPFFDEFTLRGPKSRDLAIFREITGLVQAGQHLSRDGIAHILTLRSPMNRGGKRRRSDAEILALLDESRILRGHTRSSLEEAEG